jgi:hypothetical protein
LRARRGERDAAGQQLEHQHADPVDVAARIERLASELLRRGVDGGAQDRTARDLTEIGVGRILEVERAECSEPDAAQDDLLVLVVVRGRIQGHRP